MEAVILADQRRQRQRRRRLGESLVRDREPVWPNRAGRVALASLALFLVAGIAGAFVMLC